MANHKSAEKRARQATRRNAVNTKTLGEVRTFEKKLRAAIGKKDKGESQKLLIAFSSKVDKAAQKGRLAKETASRKVSRLSKLIASL